MLTVNEQQELSAIQLLWKLVKYINEFPAAMLFELEPDEFSLLKTMFSDLTEPDEEEV